MYDAPITRTSPTAFVLMIDRSGSMKERIVFAGAAMTKARAVTLVANSFIDELLHRARREEGPCDYYDIAVLGYSGDGVSSLVSPRGEFTSPARLMAKGVGREAVSHERILPSGRSVVAVTEHGQWIDRRAEGATPMCGAMEEALSLVGKWCGAARNRESYPPTVINITDGEASDGDGDTVREVARRLCDTGTVNGHTLLMNIHLARGGESAGPVLFPSSPEELPDHRYARLLWDISSEMPESYNDMIRSMKNGSHAISEKGSSTPFRAVGWGSHIGGVAAMMNIGSINSMML